MTTTFPARLSSALAITLITLVSSSTEPVAAQTSSPPDRAFLFLAGQACSDFDLNIEFWDNQNRVIKDFKDQNGNVVRHLTAGKGSTLRFTNMETGESLVLRANGGVEHVTYNADGSQTWSTTGHNVLILFPTDVPAGPSTTLHVGHVVFAVDTNGVFTVQSVSGTSTDICTALMS